MQILIQPMYSKQELNADSNYVVMTALVRAMLKVRPDFHFVLPFPDAKSGYKYADDGFFRLPNITRIPQRISPQKMTNAVSFDGVWYNELFRRFGFEVVWVNLVESVAAISRSGDNTYEPAARSFLCAAHNYVIHESLPYPFDQLRNVASHQVIGALNADVNVFNSRHCHWMFFDMARHWLNDETLAAIEAKSVYINYGTLEDELTYCPPDPPNEVPIIAYNHRLQAYKNFKQTFSLLQELWDEGYRFRVRYMNNTSENMTEITNYPFVETRLTATRAEYLNALRGCDFNVTNSQHETFCIAAIESMALGQPLVAPNDITFPEIVGNMDAEHPHYPFLFKTWDEQHSAVIKLLTDRALRLQWGKIQSDYVRAHYNSTLWAQKYALLWEEFAYPKLGVKPDAKAMVERVIRENNGGDMETMRSKIYSQHVNGRHPLSNQSLPATKLVRLVHELGGTVKMEGGAQHLYLP